jgi:hypothetical protein
VDIPTVLTQLSNSIGLDPDALSAPLTSLVTHLRAAVPSFCGLHLTIAGEGHPVMLTTFRRRHDSDPIRTSLRIRMVALGPGYDEESQVVFYGSTPGAFVDLAADLGYSLAPVSSRGTPTPPAGSGKHRLIVLDADLPPRTTRSGITGLDERSTIDRAVGFLIDRGHQPDDARAQLRREAAVAGVDPRVYAARVLCG